MGFGDGFLVTAVTDSVFKAFCALKFTAFLKVLALGAKSKMGMGFVYSVFVFIVTEKYALFFMMS